MFTEQLIASGSGGGGGGIVPDWVGKEARDGYADLCDQFPGWTQSMKLSDSGTWGRWVGSSAPELEWPAGLGCTPFQRLLFLQVGRHTC